MSGELEFTPRPVEEKLEDKNDDKNETVIAPEIDEQKPVDEPKAEQDI